MAYNTNNFIKSTTFMDLTSSALWAQNRIVNRYRPLIANPLMAKLSSDTPVEVIVMDSGIQRNHVEFAQATIEDLYFVPNLLNISDETGHGTAMASLIAGVTVGVDPTATLKIVKIFGASYDTSEAEILDAFDAIIAYHASTPNVTKILNMSWAIPANDSVKIKLKMLSDAGVILVAAAGNYPQCIDDTLPAGFAGAVTVAGSKQSDEEYTQVYGVNKKIDIYAPAEQVCVAAFEDNVGYATTDGSSSSAALASGVLSLTRKTFAHTVSSDDVKLATMQNGTIGALLVNDRVSFTENRLLYRPDVNSVPSDQDYYAGNITIGSGAVINVSLNTFMPIEQFENIFDKLTFALEVDSEFSSSISVGPQGALTIVDPVSYVLPQDSVVKKVSFYVTASTTTITMTSPKIHYFLSSIDSTDQDIAALTDQLNSQTYLIPLTLSQLNNFK
jgi:hypothetical protein